MSIERKLLVNLHKDLSNFEDYHATHGVGALPEIAVVQATIENLVAGLPKDGPDPLTNFDIKNPQMEDILRNLGVALGALVPKNLGFTVLLFQYNTKGDGLFYLSTADRKDTIATMQEFINKNENLKELGRYDGSEQGSAGGEVGGTEAQ